VKASKYNFISIAPDSLRHLDKKTFNLVRLNLVFEDFELSMTALLSNKNISGWSFTVLSFLRVISMSRLN